MFNIAEIKGRTNIQHVWAALGGAELRYGRGRAFWRDGDGWSVAIDVDKGVWFDHAGGTGGDLVELVRTVRQCSFREAAAWLATFAGIPVSATRCNEKTDTAWATDLGNATWFKVAVRILAEWALDELPPWDPERRGLTRLLATIRLGDAALVDEYRQWRERDPRWTQGMVHAGRLHDARLQRRLANWIRTYCDGSETT
jgi:hypothetical protein